MNQAKTSKIWAISGLRDMSFDDFVSVLNQLLTKPDIGEKIAFLDVNEIYRVVDLEGEHARTLLFQKINATRR